MIYDIELGQGDSDSVTKTLYDADGVANLSGATVVFVMSSALGSLRYEITCSVGESGVVTIPFTSTYTSIPGFYHGEFKVTIGNMQYTFPSSNNLTVYIKGAL